MSLEQKLNQKIFENAALWAKPEDFGNSEKLEIALAEYLSAETFESTADYFWWNYVHEVAKNAGWKELPLIAKKIIFLTAIDAAEEDERHAYYYSYSD